jgi:pimeloyl-ACP methyl ester carboxylesterase
LRGNGGWVIRARRYIAGSKMLPANINIRANMLYKMIKYPFFGKYMVRWKNPLPESEQIEWKQISVKSKTGAHIKGLFAESKLEEVKATIVLGHPMGKEAKGYFIKRGYTNLLRENGYNTLIFDINGFGESTHGNFLYYEDIIEIGIEAERLTPNYPIGYFGISLGAQWATIAFVDKSHSYKFAILESAATSLGEFWVKFPVANKVIKFFGLILPKYKKKIEMIERIKEVKNLNSILLIYSENDDWVPIEMGNRYKANIPIPVELWTVKNAKHAEFMKSDFRNEYEQKIIHYFNTEVEKISAGNKG